MFTPPRVSENFVVEQVDTMDLQITSLVWGITLGVGFLTTWKAIKQTALIKRRYGYLKMNSPYVWMIWMVILSCLGFSIMSWLYLNELLKPSFAFFFGILTLGTLQIHLLFQILVNRISLLLTNQRKAMKFRIWVALLAACVAISVYCVWIPAQLQVSERWRRLNRIWDRCEKVLYLLIDLSLNWYFVRTVQRSLVDQGLVKYKRLVRFNMWMVGLSIGTDILIIGMMSLKNSFAYMQFHPLAYTIKLNIEISMAELIVKIAKTPFNQKSGGCQSCQHMSSIHSVESTKVRKSSVSSETMCSPIEKWELSSAHSSSSPFDIESVAAYRKIQAPDHVCFEFDKLEDMNMDMKTQQDRFGYIDGSVRDAKPPRLIFSSRGLWSGTGEAGSSLRGIALKLGGTGRGIITSSVVIKEKL